MTDLDALVERLEADLSRDISPSLENARRILESLRTLKAERDELLEAMEPFSEMALALTTWAGDPDDAVFTRILRTERRPSGVREHIFSRLTAGHFRRARSILNRIRGDG